MRDKLKRDGEDKKRLEVKFVRASEFLRQKTERSHKYQVSSNPIDRSRFSKSYVTTSSNYDEYEKARLLKQKLINSFKGVTLEKAIPGTIISNEYGNCYCVNSKSSNLFKKPTTKKSREILLSDLKLLSGIGPIWEKRLKQSGFHNIEDLMKHGRWRQQAKQFLNLIDNNNLSLLQKWLWRSLPKSHPLMHMLSGFCRDEEFILLDIETLGLFGGVIVVIGFAKLTKNKTHVTQYLLRSIKEEPSALLEFTSQLKENNKLITFNGRSFDVPYLEHRLSYYGLNFSINNPHFDILHFARRAWKHLPDRRLETLEKKFNITRDFDVPGALVPEFYDTYNKTKNVGPLVAIVEHNKQDLITLTRLFSKLYDAWEI